jgi:ketosteroid isomerase-like protein
VSEDPDLAITRAMFAAWNDGDIDRMDEFWAEDGDWIWDDPPEFPDAQRLRGRDAVQARFREVAELLGTLRVEFDALEKIGDVVLAEVRLTGAGAQSGIPVEAAGFHVIRFENGRVRWYRSFADREQALAAVRRSA